MALDHIDSQQQQPQQPPPPPPAAKVTVAYTNEPCRRKLQFVNGKFAAQKPQTSTVQRRNERERNRVRLINRTFATLRASLPPASASAAAAAAAAAASVTPPTGSSAKERRRLSKVQVLRTAAAYIAELAALLRADSAAASTSASAASNRYCYGNSWQQPQQQRQQQQQSPSFSQPQMAPGLSGDIGDSLPDLQLLLDDSGNDSQENRAGEADDFEDDCEDELEDGGRFRLSVEPDSPSPMRHCSCAAGANSSNSSSSSGGGGYSGSTSGCYGNDDGGIYGVSMAFSAQETCGSGTAAQSTCWQSWPVL